MSTSNEMWWLFCTHHATALHSSEAQALSVTHARISLPHACNQERIYGSNAENEPVLRIKMADYCVWEHYRGGWT